MNIGENGFKLERDEEFIRKLPGDFTLILFYRFRQRLVKALRYFTREIMGQDLGVSCGEQEGLL